MIMLGTFNTVEHAQARCMNKWMLAMNTTQHCYVIANDITRIRLITKNTQQHIRGLLLAKWHLGHSNLHKQKTSSVFHDNTYFYKNYPS